MPGIPSTYQSTTSFLDLTQDECDSTIQRLKHKQVQFIIKRFGDGCIALGLLLLLAPVLSLIAILIRLESPGPVIFKQQRVGQHRSQFCFYKFRSMAVQSSAAKQMPFPIDSCVNGYLFKLQQDPRVTRVGRILRKLSLDELPQLVNVLNGTMSIVGPRPLMPHMLNPYPRFSAVRHQVKPGITGLWQIRDRAHNDNAGYMISHDTQYVRDFNLILDLKIILLTIPALLSTRGAF